MTRERKKKHTQDVTISCCKCSNYMRRGRTKTSLRPKQSQMHHLGLLWSLPATIALQVPEKNSEAKKKMKIITKKKKKKKKKPKAQTTPDASFGPVMVAANHC